MSCHPAMSGKIKPLTSALRERMRALPVPGVLAIEALEFRPSRGWFIKESEGTGFYFSVRSLDDRLFVFRLK